MRVCHWRRYAAVSSLEPSSTKINSTSGSLIPASVDRRRSALPAELKKGTISESSTFMFSPSPCSDDGGVEIVEGHGPGLCFRPRRARLQLEHQGARKDLRIPWLSKNLDRCGGSRRRGSEHDIVDAILRPIVVPDAQVLAVGHTVGERSEHQP